jgi:DNA-binding response OmpR family regulator
MAAGLHSARSMAPTVLTVDPQEDLLVTYYRLLSRRGYRVITAPTRAAGLLAVEREAPRLVISDLHLPDGDGLDIVRAARSRVPPALAIVVSALTAEPARRAALTAGASAFLPKPFEAAALLDLIHSHVPIPPPAGGFR